MTRLSPYQAAAVENRHRDLLVSAGAGSGKTRVLVEAVIASVLHDAIDLDEMLVVTFTEKAAAELQARIDDALARQGRPDLRTRLPRARISTIHAFCSRLLREHFVQAEMDPRFRVIPEEDASLLLQDAMTRVFHDGYSGGFDEGDAASRDLDTEVFEALVTMCGFDAGGERLRSVVLRLLRYAQTSEDPDRYLLDHLERMRRPAGCWEEIPWRDAYARCVLQAWHAALGMVEHLTEALERRLPDEARRFRDFLDVLLAIDPRLLTSPDGQHEALRRLSPRGAVEAGQLHPKLPRMPRLSEENDDLRRLGEKVRHALDSDWIRNIPLDMDRTLADERSASRLLRGLSSLTHRVWAAYAREKERISGCDFSDLEIRTLRLVRRLDAEGSPIRFRRVFIDEFQDINELQHRILSLVCGEDGVFRVGDVKQSIYQFRLAEPGIFRALARERAAMEDPARPPEGSGAWLIPLPENYRSAAPVLAVTNAVAGGLFQDEEIGSPYAAQRLIPGRGADHAPPVEVWLVSPAEEGSEPGEADDDDVGEGRAIAERIRGWMASGATIRDPDSQEERPMRHGDIAILLRTKRRGPGIQRALVEAGIPAHLALGESFFESREIQDLMLLLASVDNLLDDVSLAGTLRSPAFAWSDADLLLLRAAYPFAVHLGYALAGLADAETHDGDPFLHEILPDAKNARATLCGSPGRAAPAGLARAVGAKAVAAMARLRAWRRMQGLMDLDAFVTSVLAESGLEAAHAAQPDGLRRRANLRKAVAFARRYARETGHGLHRFLRWFRSLEETGMPISVAQIASESMDVVRIMTIHQAKGLEFPVVILGRMDTQPMTGEAVSEIYPGRDFLGIRLLDPSAYVTRDPLPLEILREQGRQDQIAEEKRVLYVAMTRARDRLVLCRTESARGAPGEELLALYARARDRRDPFGEAVVRSLLAAKPSFGAWLAYTLGLETASDGALPLTTVRIAPQPAAPAPAIEPHIAEIERKALALSPVQLPILPDASSDPGNPVLDLAQDKASDRALDRALRVRPYPAAGFLRVARGKIWATEFKGTTDDFRRLRGRHEDDTGDAAEEDAGARAALAAREGILLHAILERLDLHGLDGSNIDERLRAAAAGWVVDEESIDLVRRAVLRLVDLPIGAHLFRPESQGGVVACEVAFGMRLGLMDVARLLPPLAEEMESSAEWRDAVERDESGAIRLRPGIPDAAADPWILVQGRIDAIVRTGDGWTILDWKSDRVAGEREIALRAERYRGQMSIYRRAVARLYGEPVAAALVFLRPAVLVPIE